MTKAGLESLLSTLKAQSKKTEDRKTAKSGVCGTSCWMKHDHEKVYPIETEQVLSLKAMIAYVSHKTGTAEYRIEREFSDHFCIPNMKCLPKNQYDQAIRFVCDQSAAS